MVKQVWVFFSCDAYKVRSFTLILACMPCMPSSHCVERQARSQQERGASITPDWRLAQAHRLQTRPQYHRAFTGWSPPPTQTATCSTQGFGQNDRRNATSKSSFQRWHFKDWNLKCCMLCWAQCNSMGISVLWSKLKWFNFFCFIKLQEKIMIKMKHKMKLNMFFL